jgi:RimJ/RimL family protein N-acetyltransferase
MLSDVYKGKLVQLTSEDSKTIGEVFSKWKRNSEYLRLLDTDYGFLLSAKRIKESITKELEKENPNGFFFTIRTLENDHLIGFVDLMDINWNHGDCWVGIGLGASDYWGKGYGTDAMKVILNYAFSELNLHRVTLGVFSYNKRAIRSYEKAGFNFEGIERSAIQRDGSRSDVIIMGILRDEWLNQLQLGTK